MIPGPANDTHVEWSLSERHPSYVSSRFSIVMALVAIDTGGEYNGPLGMLAASELTTLRDLIDEHAAARKAHR